MTFNMNGFLGVVRGRITTHNFSFIAEAKVRKFQYIKLYHEEVGFVLAQIINLVNESNEITAECEVIGYRDSRGLLRVPNTTVRDGSEVYNADSEFIKEVLGLNKEDGLYIGLLDSYDMIKVKLDYKKLISKHLAVLAKTGAGKSYTLGVIIEELMEKGIPCLIIDPHGEYSSLRLPNSNSEEIEMMDRYDIKPKGYADKIVEYSPNTEINKGARPLSISISSLTPQEIATLTPIKINGTQLGLLYNAVNAVKRDNPNYTLDDIRSHLDSINTNAKYGIYACFDFIENIGIFSNDSVKIEDIIYPNKVTLINLKGIPPDIQQIITAKICNDIFEKRKRGEIPPLFLIIEEAHNFCPERSFGESPSSYILRNIASEGRKFGLGLGVVSQRPARIDKNVLSQCSTQIIQKVTNPNDIKAISSSSENISAEVVKDISTLPIGVALVIGASARPIFVDIRIKRSEHGGKSVLTKSNIQTRATAKEPEPIVERRTVEEKVVERKIPIAVVESPVPSSDLGWLFLARLDNNTLLIDKNLNIVYFDGSRFVTKNIDELGDNISHMGDKAMNVYKIIRSKGETTVSYLFNSLDYSFQDIDFILRSLKDKGIINIVGSRIVLNSSQSTLSSYSLKLRTVERRVPEDQIPSIDLDKVASLLKKKGLNVREIKMAKIG